MGLRVLQVGSSLFDWGGIERYVAYLSHGLSARGHQVELVCPEGSPLDERFTGSKHYFALRGQFRFDRLPFFIRLFRRSRYDAVHIHFSPDFVIPALAARWTKQPLILMSRHVVLPWSPSKVRRYRKLYDHFVAVCGATKVKLMESGVSDDLITVARAGCPTLEAGPPRASCDDAFKLGFFGRLVEDKGLRILLQAAQSAPSVEFEIFGDGPLRAELEGTAGSNVRFHGFTPFVADAMASMNAIVVPSTWEEAFPFSILEAMSIGKPVLASRVGGLPEMVEDGRTGLLVERGDPPALANAVARLAADPDLVKSMGAAAQRLHREEFTVQKFAERIEEVYLNQIERRRNR